MSNKALMCSRVFTRRLLRPTSAESCSGYMYKQLAPKSTGEVEFVFGT